MKFSIARWQTQNITALAEICTEEWDKILATVNANLLKKNSKYLTPVTDNNWLIQSTDLDQFFGHKIQIIKKKKTYNVIS